MQSFTTTNPNIANYEEFLFAAENEFKLYEAVQRNMVIQSEMAEQEARVN